MTAAAAANPHTLTLLLSLALLSGRRRFCKIRGCSFRRSGFDIKRTVSFVLTVDRVAAQPVYVYVCVPAALLCGVAAVGLFVKGRTYGRTTFYYLPQTAVL